MDAAQLRPLSIGEILDIAIKIYRERFSHLVKAVAVVVGPVSLVSALVQTSAAPSGVGFLSVPDPNAAPTVDTGELWALFASFVVAGLLSFIASQIATAASFKLVGGAYLGDAPDWRESLRFALSRFRSLTWLAMLTGFLLVLGFAACIVPGVYFWGMWAVAIPVLLLEDERGRKALKRSRQLVSGRWWPTVAAVIVATILAGIVQTVFSGLVAAMAFTNTNDFLQVVVRTVATTASGALATPFTAAVSTAVYFDLRVRKEGFDLELLARRVGVEPPPGGRPDLLPPAQPPSPSEEPPFWPPPPGWQPGAPRA